MIEWKNKRLKNTFKTTREKKLKKFEHTKDYGSFKPNEERVSKDSNQTPVLNTTIDEDNTIVNPNQFKIQSMKEVNSINTKRRSNIVRENSNKSKSYADALKSHHVDNSTDIDTQPSNVVKLQIELRVQDEIAEKKSNPGKLNSEELRIIYINLMKDDKEQTSLLFDSKTTLEFRENVAFVVGSTPLLSSISTSEGFDNYDHEVICLL